MGTIALLGMGWGGKLDRRPFHDSDCTRQQQGLLIYATRHDKSLHRHFGLSEDIHEN